MRVFVPVLFIVTALAAPAGAANGLEQVTFKSAGPGNPTIRAYLLRPSGPGPFAAVVSLHGCSGLFRKNGKLGSRDADWAQRFHKAGYAVLFPDSFGSRGQKSLCKIKPRPVKHKDRVGDIRGAADWLAEQSFIDKKRIALLGWSNGGSSLMRAITTNKAPARTDFVTAIAFYPSCRWALNKKGWSPRLRPLILMGAKDDWTPPGPCKALSKRWNIKLILYPGAYHGFDAPNSRVRVLKGRAYSANKNGIVHIGTNRKARKAAIKEVMKTLKTAFGEAR